MTNSTILYREFDLDALTMGVVTKNRMGGKSVAPLYNRNRSIFMQTPAMPTPFGLSEYTPENGQIKYSIDLSYRHLETDPRVATFRNLIDGIDNKMITLGVENSIAWFGKSLSKDVVTELYRPLLKLPKQADKYMPTTKCKIRTNARDGTFNLQAFDSEKKSFDMTNFVSGATVKAIVEFAPVWFMNKQFGLTLNLIQLEVVSLPDLRDFGYSGFSFQQDDVDEYDEAVAKAGPILMMTDIHGDEEEMI